MKNYREMAEAVLRRAEEERRAIRRRRRAALLTAVPALCAALVLAVIFVPRSGKTQPRSAQAAETMPHDALRLAAYLKDLGLNAEELAAPALAPSTETPPLTREQLARSVNANTTVRGVVTSMQTVRARDGDGTLWYLATLTLAVREVLTGTASSELRVVGASAYGGGAEPEGAPIPQLAGWQEGTEGVFVLRPTGDEPWQIAEKELKPSELGEYLPVLRLEQRGNTLIEPKQQLSVPYIPALTLPEPVENAAVDMIGLVVYEGGIYTQAADYFGADAERLRGLIGERLGYATGSLTEWSGPEEYAQEFASSVAGELCTVKGYSPEFRLCLVQDGQDADGTPRLWVQFLERLNGLALASGAELYSERLRLDGRVTGVRGQSFDDWNEGRENYSAPALGAALDAFLSALNEAELQPPSEDAPGFYGGTRAMLYLDLDDGTSVRLRLLEGGKVAYDPMSGYFVRLPAEVFDPVLRAAEGADRG